MAALILAVIVLAVALLLLPAFERRSIYFPSRVALDVPVPELHHAALEEHAIATPDGERIVLWFARTRATRVGVLYYLHGNAGSLYDRTALVDGFAAAGFDVCSIDYRGYGKSSGTPSEAGLYRDAEAGLSWLEEHAGVPPGRVLLFGKSLGSAVAIELAARTSFAGLILESAFTSVRDVGRHVYPFIPSAAYALMSHRFDSLSRIRDVQCETLIVHGAEDDLIPPAMGRRLHEAAPEPKTWVLIPSAGHDDLGAEEGPAYFERIARFGRRVLGTNGQDAAGPGPG